MAVRVFSMSSSGMEDLYKFASKATKHVLLSTDKGLLYAFHGRKNGTNTADMDIVNDPEVKLVFCCYPAYAVPEILEKIPSEFRKCQTVMQLTHRSRKEHTIFALSDDPDEGERALQW